MQSCWFGILVLIFLFGSVKQASALTINPARTIITVAPGSETIWQLSITNEEVAPVRVVPTVFGARQDEKGRPVFEKKSDVAEGWIQADQNTTDLAVGQTKKIVFTIAVPAHTGPGSHYLGIGVEPVTSASGTVALGTRLLSLMSLYVAGPATEKIDVSDWSSAHSILASAEWPFQLVMKNEGTVDVSTQAHFDVKGWNGQVVMSQEFSTGNKILPESIRQLHPIVDVGGGGFLWPGRYRVEAVINYGTTNQEVRAERIIWYVPWSVIGMVGVVLSGIGFAVWRFKK